MLDDPWQDDTGYVEHSKYNKRDFISRPSLSPNCTLSEDSISFFHSFGYDCNRRNNLAVLGEHTLVFATGNFIHFLNSDTGLVDCKRTTNGTGISAFCIHPSEPILALAEKGQNPPIILYHWPSLEVIKVLRNGAKQEFGCLSFSSCGSFMASQAGAPDQTLTVWRWREEKKLVESKAPYEVNFKVTFAQNDYRRITTCGPGQLTFWKMSGDVSCRLSYRTGSFRLRPDAVVECSTGSCNGNGKVVTSTNWGNLLVWNDECKIELEISRKDGSCCHAGSIYQIVAEEGELITIGSDGWIRVWDSDNIYNAKATKHDDQGRGFFLVDPMNEVQVDPDASLMSITKCKRTGDQNLWYLQDAHGSIWRVDLSFSLSMQKPNRIYRCHASGVTDLSGSTFNSLLLSGGEDGKGCIYDLNRKILVNHIHYNASVTCLTWLPLEHDSTGMLVLMGYEDGVIRLFLIQSESDPIIGGNIYRVTKALTARFKLILARKPHSGAVRQIAVSHHHAMVATLGEDRTVFFFFFNSKEENSIQLFPCKFFKLQENPVHFCWKNVEKGMAAILIFGDGTIWEMNPDDTFFFPNYKASSFETSLPKFKHYKLFEEGLGLDKSEDFSSFRVIHGQYLSSIPNIIFILAASENFETVYAFQLNTNEQHLRTKLFCVPAHKGSSNGGQGLAVAITRAFLWLMDKVLFLGYEDGTIRIHCLEPPEDLNARISSISSLNWNFDDYMTLSIHEPTNGAVQAIFLFEVMSGHILATSGKDGGVVIYKLEGVFDGYIKFMKDFERMKREGEQYMRISWGEAALTAGIKDDKARSFYLEKRRELRLMTHTSILLDHVQDIEDPNHLSLEEEKGRDSDESLVKHVENEKLFIQRNLASMKVKFRNLQQRNAKLPETFQIESNRFQTTRFTFENINKENEKKISTIKEDNLIRSKKSKEMLDKVKKRFFEDIQAPRMIVKGIRIKEKLASFRISSHQIVNLKLKMPEVGADKMSKSSSSSVGEELRNSSTAESRPQVKKSDSVVSCSFSARASKVLASFEETFVLKKSLDHNLLDDRILKALKKQEEREKKKANRGKKKVELLSRKPNDEVEKANLDKEIAKAKLSLGQYIRRTSPKYEEDISIQSHEMKRKIVELLRQIKQKKEDFNEVVHNVYNAKLGLFQDLNELRNQLVQVQVHIDGGKRKPIPPIPESNLKEDQSDMFEINEDEVDVLKQELIQEENQLQLQNGSGNESRRSSLGSSSFFRTVQNSPGNVLSRQTSRKSSVAVASLKKPHPSDRWSPPPLDEDPYEEEEEDQDMSAWSRVRGNLTEDEVHMNMYTDVKNLHEQDLLIEKMEILINSFDGDLISKANMRKQVAVELKYAELTLIYLYEQLQILRITESHDECLLEKVKKLGKDLTETDDMIVCEQQKLSQIEADLNCYSDNLRNIYETITKELVDNKHVEHLTKYFHTKSCHSALSTSADTEELGLDYFRANSSDPGYQHPSDVNPVAIKFVEEMKARRDLLESCISNEEKALRKLEQVLIGLNARRSHQNILYLNSKEKLHQFRLKTEKMYNELTITFSLKKDQLPLHQEDRKPLLASPRENLLFEGIVDDGEKSKLLVFAHENWAKLKQRVEELKSEKAAHKQQFKEDRQIYIGLQETCKNIREEIDRLEKRSNEEIIKRFGPNVTFDEIESFTVNRTLEEIKEIAKRDKERKYQVIEKKKELVRQEKKNLTQTILSNTSFVEKKTNLIKEKSLLDQKRTFLNKEEKRAAVGKEKESEEKLELKALIDLYESQQSEIRDMQDRLSRFMTKGAPILMPNLGPDTMGRRPSLRLQIEEAKKHLNRFPEFSGNSLGREEALFANGTNAMGCSEAENGEKMGSEVQTSPSQIETNANSPELILQREGLNLNQSLKPPNNNIILKVQLENI